MRRVLEDSRPDLTGHQAVYIACVVGAILSVVLLLVEIGKDPALEVEGLEETRRGVVSSVSFQVRNTTNETLCPEVRVAARDREARDLIEAVARPAGGSGVVAPGAVVTFSASLEIDPGDYEEKLRELRPYVYESRACAGR